MANAMLLRSSRVHTAGLLCRSPSALLSAPSSSPLLCGLRWLLSAHSNFATKASTLTLCHFSASCVEQTQGTLGRKGWEIKAKAQYSSWGTSPESRYKTHCGTQDSVYPLPVSWAPKWIFTQTCASFSLHLDQRPSAKVALDKQQLTEQGRALSNVPGNRT